MELTRPDEPDDSVLDDDVLRLIFTCCHPSLAPEARLALALRTLCQLSVAQVAAAMLTSEAAMAKRLTRTRQKITLARIGYRVPADAELPERLGAVCGVVHALYTAGHAPLTGESVLDVDLCAEGLRLARELHRLLPDEAMPAAVLALILLTEARRPARIDEHGDPVLLADQDRAALGPVDGRRGRRAAGGQPAADRRRRRPLPAAGRDRRTSTTGHRRTPTPTGPRSSGSTTCCSRWRPALRRRSAGRSPLAERDGPEAGLAALADLPADQRREAVRSELLGRLGRFAEAVEAVSAALDEEAPAGQRRYWERRRAEWRAAAEPARQVGGTA